MSSRKRPVSASQTDEPAASGRAGSSPQPEDARPLEVARIRLLVLLSAAFCLVVFTRLALWQLPGRADASDSAAAETTDVARGRIVDATGLPLVSDIFRWEIGVDPLNYRDARSSTQEVTETAQKTGIPLATLTAALVHERHWVLVVPDATRAQCQAAEAKEAPTWIRCDGRRQRTYPQGSLGAAVVGFANRGQIGQLGVEASYDDWLRGASDRNAGQLPGQPEPLPAAWNAYLPSPNGHDLVLHLVAPLQYRVEETLAAALADYQAKTGTIIVLDARTSAVLALANWPTFDPNRFAEADPRTWSNAAISALYEPGSVFKLITFGGALDARLLTPDSLYTDTGSLTVGDKTIRNSEGRVLGVVTARQALANSLNVVSAQIAREMGADIFYRYVRQFGFGKVTEVDLRPESAGIVKRPGTTFFSQYDQAANSFGQGISVTPLQMANAVAAIANGGTLMQPQIVKALVYDGQMHRIPPRRLGQAIRPEAARTLAQMMVFTTESYAQGYNLVPGYRVAGKTGTAEIPQQEGYTLPLTITSFAGFLPAADPQVVILVVLTEPRTSRWAEQVALPVFGKVGRDAVQVLKIPSDDRMP